MISAKLFPYNNNIDTSAFGFKDNIDTTHLDLMIISTKNAFSFKEIIYNAEQYLQSFFPIIIISTQVHLDLKIISTQRIWI